MVSLASLWIPILVSAAVVFVASSIIHMLLPYHRTDFRQAPAEDDVMDALRKTGIAPGDYVVPFAGSPARMKDPDFVARMTRGPIAFMTIMKGGPPEMGAQLAQWFLYCALISTFAAYMASRALGAGSEYLAIFRFAGTAAFLGYAGALLQNSIWYRRAWSSTLKSMFDGIVYALLTGGIFGWLWPK